MLRSIAISVVALSLAIPAAADSGSKVLSRILDSGTLRVGMSGNQPPLNFKGKNGDLMGMEVDLAAALATAMRLDLEVVQKPFGELLGALSAGEIDMVISGMTVTPRRNTKAAFVGPYFISGKSILTRSSALAAVEGAGALDKADLEFVALAGSTSEEFVEAALPKAKLVTTPDYDTAVKLLLEDKVDALVADREIVALTAFRNPEAGLASLREPLTIEPIGIAVPPGDPLLVNHLENLIGALEGSGLLSALRARWLERNDWLTQLP
ncbi:MAG: transporter substrate-binding domain-containing protein [Myxococcota bacterium]|nr:transporter substrate-binding domain-containing protein [Myxococcota bacterium]